MKMNIKMNASITRKETRGDVQEKRKRKRNNPKMSNRARTHSIQPAYKFR